MTRADIARQIIATTSIGGAPTSGEALRELSKPLHELSKQRQAHIQTLAAMVYAHVTGTAIMIEYPTTVASEEAPWAGYDS